MVKPENLADWLAGRALNACDFDDPQRDALLQEIHRRHGDSVRAVLLYGSYLRGKRDTLLDFYVLIDRYADLPGWWQGLLARALPPNVYQISAGEPPNEARAKYALLTLSRFESAVAKDFHSYFWARFAQPCAILYVRNGDSRDRVASALCEAHRTFLRRVLPRLESRFDTAELWRTGLTLTYQCEFRSEAAQHAGKLYDHAPDYYSQVTRSLAPGLPSVRAADDPDRWIKSAGPSRFSKLSWGVRRWQGKLLSVMRLAKAAFTFDGALDYLLWKIGRHSGVYVEASERQRRFPLLFAWPLLWRLWRQGAFR